MNPETIQAIKEALVPVAEKIGQGAGFGWEVVVQQQIVYAWLGVFAAIVGTITAIVLGRILQRHCRGKEFFETEPFVVMFGGAVFLGGIFAAIQGSITAITHFLNPHYYALQFFISLGQSAL